MCVYFHFAQEASVFCSAFFLIFSTEGNGTNIDCVSTKLIDANNNEIQTERLTRALMDIAQGRVRVYI